MQEMDRINVQRAEHDAQKQATEVKTLTACQSHHLVHIPLAFMHSTAYKTAMSFAKPKYPFEFNIEP